MPRWRSWARHTIMSNKPAGVQAAISVAGLAIAIVARIILDGNSRDVPFVTYFPVMLICSLILEWPWGIAVAVGSLVLADRMAMGRIALPLGSVWVAYFAFYVLTSAIIVGSGAMLRALLRENANQASQMEIFNVELRHRTKNALSIARALLARAQRDSDPRAAVVQLMSRLDALISANELLQFGSRPTCNLGDLIVATIAPFAHDRFRLSGPVCIIARDGAVPLTMAIHELCTNSSKYGSLSNEVGYVILEWHLENTSNGELIRLDWREIDGPKVRKPTRTGVGTRLLSPSSGLLEVRTTFHPAGLEATLVVAAVPAPCPSHNSG